MANPEPNWAWLGLLKWSLKYQDGTVPSEESPNFKQLSPEDKAFLEEVMKNGVIDEGKRMQTILNELVKYLEEIKIKENNPNEETSEDTSKTNEIIEIMEELRGIVEQIDYAKSFASMGGLQFLIGCASESKFIPQRIRTTSLLIIATLCQNNPSVQYSMLEMGNVGKLLEIFFAADEESNEDTALILQERVVQALSSCIRNHDMAEQIFCLNTQGSQLINRGLGINEGNQSDVISSYRFPIVKRTLFFLQAIVTSDTATSERIKLFVSAIQHVISTLLDPEKCASYEIREMALSMLVRILEQRKSVNCILDLKNSIVSLGVHRVATLRALSGEEREYAEEELNLWEQLIVDIARVPRDEQNTENMPLLLEPSKNVPQ